MTLKRSKCLALVAYDQVVCHDPDPGFFDQGEKSWLHNSEKPTVLLRPTQT